MNTFLETIDKDLEPFLNQDACGERLLAVIIKELCDIINNEEVETTIGDKLAAKTGLLLLTKNYYNMSDKLYPTIANLSTDELAVREELIKREHKVKLDDYKFLFGHIVRHLEDWC